MKDGEDNTLTLDKLMKAKTLLERKTKENSEWQKSFFKQVNDQLKEWLEESEKDDKV